jgi:hypothetical protein
MDPNVTRRDFLENMKVATVDDPSGKRMEATVLNFVPNSESFPATTTISVAPSFSKLKKARLTLARGVTGFFACKSLERCIQGSFLAALHTYRQPIKVRTTRSKAAAIQTEQLSSARDGAGVQIYFHPFAEYSSVVENLTYKSAASVNVPTLRVMPEQNGPEAQILERYFAFFDLQARLALSGSGVDNSFDPLLHGDKQMWYLDHITVGIRDKGQATDGVMQPHNDSFYYGHVIVVFNICGTAELQLDCTTTTERGLTPCMVLKCLMKQTVFMAYYAISF